MADKNIGIRTQQGFSQHTLWLNEEDAKIYTDLLERNRIWYVNLATGKVFEPNESFHKNIR